MTGQAVPLLVKLLLGPLLLMQGRWVRWRTPILPEPAGERVGSYHACDGGGDGVLRLLVLGDSAAAGVGVMRQEQTLAGQLAGRLCAHGSVVWTVIAKTGATTASTLRQLQRFPAEPFDVVVMSLGVNDVTSGAAPDTVIGDLNALLLLLKQKFGAGQIIISGLPPMGLFPALPQPLRWYLGRQAIRLDQHIKTLAEAQERCHHYRQPTQGDLSMMASDGFHPGAAAYADWAEAVYRMVREPQREKPDICDRNQ